MENNIKSELMYRLSDYIGTFATLDALRPGMILPGHVKSFLDMENKIGFVSPERRYEAPTVARPPQM